MKTKIRKKSALVLGGGGFIGGHLAKRLKSHELLTGIREKWRNLHIICILGFL